jgi:hypothetical protein
MAIERSVSRPAVGLAGAHVARVASSGLARHAHLGALVDGSPPHLGRDLADAVHLLCSLHGRFPGLIDLARSGAHAAPAAAADWLARAADSFARERELLVRLTAAVGPLPSTPGAAETEASLLAQRHALETLAASERRGCAIGAASALIGDWWAVRALLDRVAARVGMDCPPPLLPDEGSAIAALQSGDAGLSVERAFAFGAEQLLLQHRALFDLLEARSEARGDF